LRHLVILLFVSVTSIAAQYAYTPDSSHTKREKRDVEAAENKVNETIWTKCFSDYVLTSDLVQTNGLDNEGVLNTVLSGSGEFPVHMYRGPKYVVGYHTPGDPTIYTNRRNQIHREGWPCLKGANFLHETMHEFGFDHDYEPTARRPFSVPYQVQHGIERCCR